VGAATLLVKLLDGVRRPGIAVTFGTAKGPCTLIDVGANVHCQPEDLYTYGEMASAYMRAVYRIDRPRVGLLNIGQEDAKGNDLTKKTQAMLRESRLNFVGNIEGQDIFGGTCDVVVCEGFVGNVVLKVSEGLGQFMASSFHEAAKRQGGGAGGAALERATREVLRNTDYAEYGGAPLLGVDGLVIICHGRSDERAIANAFRVARQFLEEDVNRRIVEELANGPNRDAAAEAGE
jgi:glycerol-3-phosphate acyltransferase PlsX